MFFFNWNDQKKDPQTDDSSQSPMASASTVSNDDTASHSTVNSSDPSASPSMNDQAQSGSRFGSAASSAAHPATSTAVNSASSGSPAVAPSSSTGQSRSQDESAANLAEAQRILDEILSNYQDSAQQKPGETNSAQAEPASQPASDSQPDYVEAYEPPEQLRHTPWSDQAGQPAQSAQSAEPTQPTPGDTNAPANSPAKPALDSLPVLDHGDFEPVRASRLEPTPAQDFSPAMDQFGSTISASAPTQTQSAQSAEPTQPTQPQSPQPDTQPNNQLEFDDDAESLESQNIFTLLGAEDGAEEDKESFLDELQQVVWEDFVENDVEKILTAEEYAKFKDIVGTKELSNEDMQEEALTYLESIVPQLEEILLEKALELKGEMVRERIAGMREFFVTQTDKLQTIAKAEEAINQGRWKTGADLLNTIE